ncbi:MAG: alpha-ketoacid dehydrogenase subunit beta [Planctomycetes bacterium]|nr:alpha-ketoacid dehydrogenase subunit beta [Planctomycetota bacterium]
MTIAYLEAIRLALGESLDEDPRVFLYGQDIAGAFGGAFKVTKGIAERHQDRVLNSPISEDAMAGIAIGAALEGMRPVIEFQFADFATIAFNQFVNHAATIHWRTGRSCPFVARLPVGGTPGGGPFHSQMPESWLSHHPGLVVVAPATVADAYFMLKDAIACLDPVMFCEHKYLYYHLKADFDKTRAEHLPLGAAAIRRGGGDCTIISYSGMVHEALRAAEILSRDHDLDCEVIDLRCLRPLDTETILNSVARTGRVVVATESWPFGGVAAEVLALVSSEGFSHLDAPPRRLCALDTPIPFHPDLFAAHHPDAERIADVVLETMAF